MKNRLNGSAMGQTLLKLGHIQEVDLRDGTSGYSPKFSDSDKLYRFVREQIFLILGTSPVFNTFFTYVVYRVCIL